MRICRQAACMSVPCLFEQLTSGILVLWCLCMTWAISSAVKRRLEHSCLLHPAFLRYWHSASRCLSPDEHVMDGRWNYEVFCVAESKSANSSRSSMIFESWLT